MPEEEIQEWSEIRARLDSEKRRTIESIIDKLEGSTPAKLLFGMTDLDLFRLRPSQFDRSKGRQR
jgi:hypothetical protein